MPLEEFIQTRKELMELEHSEEIGSAKFMRENMPISRLLIKKLALSSLKLTSMTNQDTHLLCEFSPVKLYSNFDTEKISQGDIIGVTQSHRSFEIIKTGVVSNVNNKCITVFFDEKGSLVEDSSYHLIKLGSEITFNRIKNLLKNMHSYTSGVASSLFSLFFSPVSSSPTPQATSKSTLSHYFNPNLDNSQKAAIYFALYQPHLAVIHGPPGTGKTTTIVEIICQLAHQGKKAFVCAPSNIAVDNIIEKLKTYKHISMIRLGHPARMADSVREYSIDATIAKSDQFKIVRDIEMDIAKLSEQRDSKSEMNKLRKEVNFRKQRIEKQTFMGANVVLATLISASEHVFNKFPDNYFDLAIIDEASQCIEPACWLPLIHVNKCIMAGDTHQLPPTIISKKAAQNGLAVTLMERALAIHGDSVKKMLNVQYRMNEVIMEWPSKMFYNNQLKAHSSVKDQLLFNLPNIKGSGYTKNPLFLIDTIGKCKEDVFDLEEESKGNIGEAKIVCTLCKYLLHHGLNADDIGVITPYSQQVKIIRDMLVDLNIKIEVKTVDGFQGREKEAIICSLVRSNKIGEIGFLCDERRINVALTRAKRHLTIVCDTTTLRKHKFFSNMISHIKAKGMVTTFEEFEYESSNDIVDLSDDDEENNGYKKRIHEEDKSKVIKQLLVNKIETQNAVVVETSIKDQPTSQENQSEEHKSEVETKAVVQIHKGHRKKSSKKEKQIIKSVREFIENPKTHSHRLPLEQTETMKTSIDALVKKFNLTLTLTKDFYLVSKCSGETPKVKYQEDSDAKGDLKSGTLTEVYPKSASEKRNFSKPNLENRTFYKKQGSFAPKIVDSSFSSASAFQAYCSSQTSESDSDWVPKSSEGNSFDVLKSLSSESIEEEEKNSESESDDSLSFSLANSSWDTNLTGDATSTIVESKVFQKPSKSNDKEMVAQKSYLNTKSKWTNDKKKANEPELTDDELLESLQRANKFCFHSNCKVSTTVIGLICEFCNQKFCTKHHLPEIHGCTKDCRKKAHKDFRTTNQNVSSTKHSQIKNEMKKKMDKLAAQRKQKQKK